MAVDFGNVKTDGGLKKLNDHMVKNSYVCGYQATVDDEIVIKKLLTIPGAAKYPHAYRWYLHMMQMPEWKRNNLPSGKMTPEKTEVKKSDDDFDLFAEDTAEEKEAAKKMAEAHKKDAEKKKKKVVEKSSLVLEIKPYDTSVDLDKVAALVKDIKIEGLSWGEKVEKAPVAYGLNKLRLSCTIIDELVNTDDITEAIQYVGMTEENAKKMKRAVELEEQGLDPEDEVDDEDENIYKCLVQSTEIVSFNKL